MNKFKFLAKIELTGFMATCGLLLWSVPAFAQSASDTPPPVDPNLERPPPLPPKIQDEQIEPTVTIRQEEDRRIEEYSHNGKIFMVKITPEDGVPYYFMDLDGDGNLERDERSRAFQPVEPAQWKIKEWK